MFDLEEKKTGLRYGWTTGACATAASVGAFLALMGVSRREVEITLPQKGRVSFALFERGQIDDRHGFAVVEKDAGDDPDVTHGAFIRVDLKCIESSEFSVRFLGGEGVGVVTKAGLPLKVGEPAINPKPREMMLENLKHLAEQYRYKGAIELTISVKNGEKLAEKTWNPRLGIMGGLSILGTTGVVKPYSCSAWIHSIHRGIDVLRASGKTTVVGATGKTSEKVAIATLGLEQDDVVDMGDFVGGMLKYLRRHPMPEVVIAGGLAKLTKLAQGALDLHSKRSQVDFKLLSEWAELHNLCKADVDWIATEPRTVGEVAERFGAQSVSTWIGEKAKVIVQKNLPKEVRVVILVVSRDGQLLYKI